MKTEQRVDDEELRRIVTALAPPTGMLVAQGNDLTNIRSIAAELIASREEVQRQREDIELARAMIDGLIAEHDPGAWALTGDEAATLTIEFARDAAATLSNVLAALTSGKQT